MRLALLILVLASRSFVCAQSDAVFTPPNAYPVSRYEAGWNKNPFTLKTAPVLLESASFAKDLAIGTYYGDAADPTVVLVNTKTHERIPLRKGKPGANGMKLGEVKLGGSRKDITAEVTMGAETSQIHYDDAYLKQVAASEGVKAPQGQQQQQQGRPNPGMPPNVQVPGQQMKIPLPSSPGGPGGRPAGVASNSPTPMNGGMGGPGNFSRPGNPGVPSISLSNPSASPSPSPASSSSPVAQLVPERRRLITPAGN